MESMAVMKRKRDVSPLSTVANFILRCTLVSLFMLPTAKAVIIEYSAQNLSGNFWEYSYFVSNNNFNQFEGFQVDFDYNFYSALASTPLAPNSDWSPITFNSDPALFANGVYDAIALVNSPSTADPFVVSFQWLGIGQPSSQTFSLYSCEDEFCSTGVTFGQSGITIIQNSGGGGTPPPTSIPEPLPTLLIALGLIGLAFTRRKKAALY